jgi:2-keto-3-deoxy-galactonokinase
MPLAVGAAVVAGLASSASGWSETPHLSQVGILALGGIAIVIVELLQKKSTSRVHTLSVAPGLSGEYHQKKNPLNLLHHVNKSSG